MTHSLLLIAVLFIHALDGWAQVKPPRPAHIIIVIEENHAFKQIIGNANAPYINSLAQQGASFINFTAFHHPSQPNYIDLFSGSPQGVTNDDCPPQLFTAPSFGGELDKQGFSFRGYAEDLPNADLTNCKLTKQVAKYARKHCPWIDFADVKPQFSLPLTQFPTDFDLLPTVAFVIPNLDNDMHDGQDPKRIKRADDWLRQKLDAYVKWAGTHNSLLILTWDEDNQHDPHDTTAPANKIPTIIVGQGVKAGDVTEAFNHRDLLRTLEEMYDLPLLAGSKSAKTITSIWQAP